MIKFLCGKVKKRGLKQTDEFAKTSLHFQYTSFWRSLRFFSTLPSGVPDLTRLTNSSVKGAWWLIRHCWADYRIFRLDDYFLGHLILHFVRSVQRFNLDNKTAVVVYDVIKAHSRTILSGFRDLLHIKSNIKDQPLRFDITAIRTFIESL